MLHKSLSVFCNGWVSKSHMNFEKVPKLNFECPHEILSQIKYGYSKNFRYSVSWYDFDLQLFKKNRNFPIVFIVITIFNPTCIPNYEYDAWLILTLLETLVD